MVIFGRKYARSHDDNVIRLRSNDPFERHADRQILSDRRNESHDLYLEWLSSSAKDKALAVELRLLLDNGWPDPWWTPDGQKDFFDFLSALPRAGMLV
jgi:hypothetical protein